MAAHQDPLSLGFSRQEHWSRLPFPSPMQESENESEVVQSCPTLSDPMDCSLPGSSVHGIFQARLLEWGAIAFSELHFSKALKFFFKKSIHLKRKARHFYLMLAAKCIKLFCWTFCMFLCDFGVNLFPIQHVG